MYNHEHFNRKIPGGVPQVLEATWSLNHVDPPLMHMKYNFLFYTFFRLWKLQTPSSIKCI